MFNPSIESLLVWGKWGQESLVGQCRHCFPFSMHAFSLQEWTWMCLHKARLATNTFLCGMDSEQWPQCWMAVFVGPRVSCLLLQMLLLGLPQYFSLPFSYVWTLNQTCKTQWKALAKGSLHKSFGLWCFHLAHEVDQLLKSRISSKLLFFCVFPSTGKTGAMLLFIDTVKLLALDCFHNHGHMKGL